MSTRSPITTHVLDISRGKPAGGISVTLEKRVSESEWRVIKKSSTNSDGRIDNLLQGGTAAESGVYRLGFETGEYFRSSGISTLYPYALIVFEVTSSGEHYHIPLLLSPFGYSTYRGT